jgi:hypothetical protein
MMRWPFPFLGLTSPPPRTKSVEPHHHAQEWAGYLFLLIFVVLTITDHRSLLYFLGLTPVPASDEIVPSVFPNMRWTVAMLGRSFSPPYSRDSLRRKNISTIPCGLTEHRFSRPSWRSSWLAANRHWKIEPGCTTPKRSHKRSKNNSRKTMLSGYSVSSTMAPFRAVLQWFLLSTYITISAWIHTPHKHPQI